MPSVALNIESVTYRGRGVARQDGRVIFVRGALPGETVAATVTATHKRYAEAEIDEILTASTDRIEPVCPLADRCPGCAYQHVSADGECRAKQAQLSDFLSRNLELDPAAMLRPPVAGPRELRYRNKVTLHGGIDSDGAIVLGYRGFDNSTLVDVPDCLLAVQPLADLLAARRQDADFMESLRPQRNVTLRWTEADGALCWRVGVPEPVPRWLTEHTVLGALRVPRDGFFQVNREMADALVTDAMDIVKAAMPEKVVDLYCGVGVFALAAARVGTPYVLGVELDRDAIRCARQNAEALGVPEVEFADVSASRAARDALAPLAGKAGMLIVDPPRRGLDPKVLEAMVRTKPEHVVYVSCAPDTLVRDLQVLLPAGYAIRQTGLYNMFPRTGYFETLTWLSR